MWSPEKAALDRHQPNKRKLRRGWTTGACATAALGAACTALFTRSFPDPVSITLPGGSRPLFSLSHQDLGSGTALAAVKKDAGDDPDVTHGAHIRVRVGRAPCGAGIVFRAGDGVGRVTRPGLPVAVGEPAINPVPRRMMTSLATKIAQQHAQPPDLDVEVSIPGGESLAQKTWNPRLGIVGGLSILGTTGIVIPYSCSAWIHSIHSGIDVARACGLSHVVGSTGAVSERGMQSLFRLPPQAFLDMGDFVGGLLKYLRRHPVSRVSLAGGVGKLSKLACGHMNLHSHRSQVPVAQLARWLEEDGGPTTKLFDGVSGAGEMLARAPEHAATLATRIARNARKHVLDFLQGGSMKADVYVFDRNGRLLGWDA